jgi:hypothetical protein
MTITHIFTPATAGATKINHEQRAGSVKAHLVSPLNNYYTHSNHSANTDVNRRAASMRFPSI